MNVPQVPLFLCGTYQEVRRNWRRVLKRGIELNSIVKAANSEQFIPIDDAPGQIILSEPSNLLIGEHLIIFGVFFQLFDKTYTTNKEQWYQQCKHLILEGVEEFWFALAMLADTPWFPLGTSYDREAPQVNSYVLLELLRWWPEFMKLDHLFYSGNAQPCPWFRWGRKTWGLARTLGKDTGWIRSHLQDQDAEDAAKSLWTLVEPS